MRIITQSSRKVVLALAVWALLFFVTSLLAAGLFAGGCRKPGLGAEPRLFRCGWSWTLGAPFRALGDPPEEHAQLRLNIGIAEAELGQSASAAASFAEALRLAGYSPSRSEEGATVAIPASARRLIEEIEALPDNHPAHKLIRTVLTGLRP